MEVEPNAQCREIGGWYRTQKLNPRIVESELRFSGHEDRKKEREMGHRSA